MGQSTTRNGTVALYSYSYVGGVGHMSVYRYGCPYVKCGLWSDADCGLRGLCCTTLLVEQLRVLVLHRCYEARTT
eukprot:scaffold305339_cov19-Prasinocladus_malaysianus.AAC.1